MINDLFHKINSSTVIQIVSNDKPDEPGYVWKFGTQKSTQVYETPDLALVNGINHIYECYEKKVFECARASIDALNAKDDLNAIKNTFDKSESKNEPNPKIAFSKNSWEDKDDELLWIIIAYLTVVVVLILGVSLLASI